MYGITNRCAFVIYTTHSIKCVCSFVSVTRNGKQYLISIVQVEWVGVCIRTWLFGMCTRKSKFIYGSGCLCVSVYVYVCV